MVGEIFQKIAKAFATTSKFIKLNQTTQYRILIGIRILIGSSVPFLTMFILVDPSAFNLEPDAITILALGSLGAALFYFLGKQLHFLYDDKTKIQDVINQKFIDEVPAKKYLKLRIGQMCEWLILSMILATGFWLGCSKLHSLYLLLGLPAFADTLVVITIVSWEYNQITEKATNGLSKSLSQ